MKISQKVSYYNIINNKKIKYIYMCVYIYFIYILDYINIDYINIDYINARIHMYVTIFYIK